MLEPAETMERPLWYVGYYSRIGVAATLFCPEATTICASNGLDNQFTKKGKLFSHCEIIRQIKPINQSVNYSSIQSQWPW